MRRGNKIERRRLEVFSQKFSRSNIIFFGKIDVLNSRSFTTDSQKCTVHHHHHHLHHHLVPLNLSTIPPQLSTNTSSHQIGFICIPLFWLIFFFFSEMFSILKYLKKQLPYTVYVTSKKNTFFKPLIPISRYIKCRNQIDHFPPKIKIFFRQIRQLEHDTAFDAKHTFKLKLYSSLKSVSASKIVHLYLDI